MSRFIAIMSLLILLLLGLLPNAPALAQTSEERLLPRFGSGWATLFRPVEDYNFKTAFTPNNHYVVGMSYDQAAIFYLWDVRNLNDTQIQPEPQSIDLSEYTSQNRGVRHLDFTVINDERVVVRVDSYLLQMSIPDLKIGQTLELQ